MAIGIALGIVTALMRLSDNGLLARVARLYIVCFRATPALVQLISASTSVKAITWWKSSAAAS